MAATPAGAVSLERLRAWPGEHRVVVGLSGGVDSSLTAALLVEAGWQVFPLQPGGQVRPDAGLVPR